MSADVKGSDARPGARAGAGLRAGVRSLQGRKPRRGAVLWGFCRAAWFARSCEAPGGSVMLRTGCGRAGDLQRARSTWCSGDCGSKCSGVRHRPIALDRRWSVRMEPKSYHHEVSIRRGTSGSRGRARSEALDEDHAAAALRFTCPLPALPRPRGFAVAASGEPWMGCPGRVRCELRIPAEPLASFPCRSAQVPS
jgi:hypothetical protein